MNGPQSPYLKRSTSSCLRFHLFWWLRRRTGLGSISHICCLSVCFVLPSASVPLLLWYSIPVGPSPSTCQRSSHRRGQLSLDPNSEQEAGFDGAQESASGLSLPLTQNPGSLHMFCYLACCSVVPLRTSTVARLRSQNGLGQKWFLLCQESPS